MEKVIRIDGQDVRFGMTAALPLYYAKYFGSDVYRDALTMGADQGANTTLMFRMIWTMAFQADKSIKPLEQWIEGFNSFPIYKVFNELSDMFWMSITGPAGKTDPARVSC